MTYTEIKAMQDKEREIAQWYTLISEQLRQSIFSALSTSQRRQAIEYGLTLSWNRLPQYARALVVDEYHASNAEVR